MRTIRTPIELFYWILNNQRQIELDPANPKIMYLEFDIISTIEHLERIGIHNLNMWVDIGQTHCFPDDNISTDFIYSAVLREAWRALLDEVTSLTFDEFLGMYGILKAIITSNTRLSSMFIVSDWNDGATIRMRRKFRSKYNLKKFTLIFG